MKTEPKTKLDMKNKTASKEFDDDVMSANYVIGRCHFFNLWPIWSNQEAGFSTHRLQKAHFH